MKIPVFGNGDIDSPQKAKEYREKYGVDGVMIGRAAIGYPWIFNEIKHFMATGEMLDPPTIAQRVEAAREHLDKSIEWKGEKLGVLEMRRHYTNYFKAYPGIKEYRSKLVNTEEAQEIYEILNQIAVNFNE
jgi:tRNA-dihydrouridine synthase B